MTRQLDVFVIRGAPGAGKSTLGRKLWRALPGGAVLEVDDFRAMLCQVDWASRDDHDAALDAAMAAIVAYVARGRRPIVLIDTFSRSRLSAVQAFLRESRMHHYTLSLWVDPRSLAQRLEARASGFKDWEPSKILNDEVRTNRYPAEHFIDATALAPDAVLAAAVALIRACEDGSS